MTRTLHLTRTLASLTLAGAAAVTTLRAANGDIPIYQPTVITQAGHYVVTRDIASTGGSVISFGTTGAPNFSNVTLDLNGHTLSTDNTSPVIVVDGALFKRGLTIRNGRLKGSGTGIGDAIQGFGANLDVRIQDLEIADFGGSGVRFDSVGHVEIARCRIHDIGANGMGLNLFGSAPFSGVILDNTLERIQRDGIALAGPQGGRVKGNVITQFSLEPAISYSGIVLHTNAAIGEVDGNMIEDNIVTSYTGANVNFGIEVSSDVNRNQITDNVVDRSWFGILVHSHQNRIERNVSSNNRFVGIWGSGNTGARNHLEGNQVQGNVCGIHLTNGNTHTYRNNVGGANTGGPACITAGNLDLGGNTGL